jgi:hypothetical protein
MESINSLGLASLLSKTQVSVEQDTESSAGQGQRPHIYTYGGMRDKEESKRRQHTNEEALGLGLVGPRTR